MKLSIFGTGYVGLVTGACMAEVGHSVVCIDVDRSKIDKLKAGAIPIWEPGLEPIVTRNVAEGRLRFTIDVEEAVKHADVQFIAVGTPPDEDGSADLQYVLAVAVSGNRAAFLPTSSAGGDRIEADWLRSVASTALG